MLGILPNPTPPPECCPLKTRGPTRFADAVANANGEVIFNERISRTVIERYVRKVTVASRRVGPRKLEADVRVYLRLKPAPIAVDNATCSPGGKRSKRSASSRPSGASTGASA
jgi:hypothetical protein